MTNVRNLCRIQAKNKSPSGGIWCVLVVLHKSSFMYVHVFLLGIRNGELMFNSTLEILLTLCNAWRYWLLFFQALHERCREYFWQYIHWKKMKVMLNETTGSANHTTSRLLPLQLADWCDIRFLFIFCAKDENSQLVEFWRVQEFSDIWIQTASVLNNVLNNV